MTGPLKDSTGLIKACPAVPVILCGCTTCTDLWMNIFYSADSVQAFRGGGRGTQDDSMNATSCLIPQRTAMPPHSSSGSFLLKSDFSPEVFKDAVISPENGPSEVPPPPIRISPLFLWLSLMLLLELNFIYLTGFCFTDTQGI